MTRQLKSIQKFTLDYVIKMYKAQKPAKIFGIFSACASSLVGAYYLQPPSPDARAIFLHNALLCKETCSVGGGAQTEKIHQNLNRMPTDSKPHKNKFHSVQTAK